jgi:hypothetical protein
VLVFSVKKEDGISPKSTGNKLAILKDDARARSPRSKKIGPFYAGA